MKLFQMPVPKFPFLDKVDDMGKEEFQTIFNVRFIALPWLKQ